MQTKFFGDIEVQASNVYHFKKGLPAFENLTNFALLMEEESEGIYFLQSTTDKNVCFILISPWKINKKFVAELPTKLYDEIGYSDDVEMYWIACMHKTFEKSTVNTMAPIFLNPNTKRGIQYILSTGFYKKPLWELFKKEEV